MKVLKYIKCSRCLESKHPQEFSPVQRQRGIDGIYRRCKLCLKDRARKTYNGHTKYGPSSKISLRKKPLRNYIITSSACRNTPEELRQFRQDAIRSIFRLWCKTGVFNDYSLTKRTQNDTRPI